MARLVCVAVTVTIQAMTATFGYELRSSIEIANGVLSLWSPNILVRSTADSGVRDSSYVHENGEASGETVASGSQ